MSVDLVRSVLLWCSVINYAILILWFCMRLTAHSWLYRLLGQRLGVTEPQWNLCMLSAMIGYKLLVIVFNVVPFIALCIVR